MNNELTQSEFENLSAWMDGELDVEQAEAVARKVEDDPVWAGAYRELLALDEMMDVWELPSPSAELTAKILARAKDRSGAGVLRFARWVMPAAAAAIFIIAITLSQSTRHSSSGRNTPRPASAVPDSFVQGGLELFTNMENRITPAGKLNELNHLRGSQVTVRPASRSKSWRSLSSAQRTHARRHAVIFLRMDTRQQKRILIEHDQVINTSQRMQEARRRQIRWIHAVVQSFTPSERRLLSKMTPPKRAKEFLRRRDHLIRTGKLPKS